MKKSLEERVDMLEKRVAALEEQVQAQPTTINLNMQLQDSYFVDYLLQCIIHYQKELSKSGHVEWH
ncbi:MULTISPECIES: hypothetical protein [Clostridium]|uniref:DUF2508 family protein n=1 Tax=Clostridium lapidicellarium TaxID=3240931 RepID=A0ABV4DXL0_9CLOT